MIMRPATYHLFRCSSAIICVWQIILLLKYAGRIRRTLAALFPYNCNDDWPHEFDYYDYYWINLSEQKKKKALAKHRHCQFREEMFVFFLLLLADRWDFRWFFPNNWSNFRLHPSIQRFKALTSKWSRFLLSFMTLLSIILIHRTLTFIRFFHFSSSASIYSIIIQSTTFFHSDI